MTISLQYSPNGETISFTDKEVRSRKRAINQFCRQCIVDDRSGNGTSLQQITLCSSESCPLWTFRPVSSIPIPKSILERIRLSERVVGHFSHVSNYFKPIPKDW